MSKSTKTASKSKTVSLVEIAQSIDMSPKNARRIMRKYESQFEKSKEGWKFPASQRANVVKFLQS